MGADRVVGPYGRVRRKCVGAGFYPARRITAAIPKPPLCKGRWRKAPEGLP